MDFRGLPIPQRMPCKVRYTVAGMGAEVDCQTGYSPSGFSNRLEYTPNDKLQVSPVLLKFIGNWRQCHLCQELIHPTVAMFGLEDCSTTHTGNVACVGDCGCEEITKRIDFRQSSSHSISATASVFTDLHLNQAISDCTPEKLDIGMNVQLFHQPFQKILDRFAGKVQKGRTIIL